VARKGTNVPLLKKPGNENGLAAKKEICKKFCKSNGQQNLSSY